MSLAQALAPEKLVLIADPNDEPRRVYCHAFQSAAWTCEEACDGREALVKVLSRHPVALVTSTSLPFIDGFELTQLLRNDAETQSLPILLVAPDPVAVEERRAFAVGADAIIVRPMPSLLVAKMTELIAHSRELRSRADVARTRITEQMERYAEILDRSATHVKLVRSHHRYRTMTPPLAPPTARCPECDAPLAYMGSQIGGVSSLHAEQWDYYECPHHGEFQYRQRTRKLRRV